MANTKLGIEIVADNAKALKGLRQVEEGLKDVSGQAEKTSKKSSGLRDVLGGIAVGAGLKFAIGEFEEAQTSAAQTAAVIKSTGNAAEISAAQQDKMVNSLSKLAAVDDEVVNGGANVLRTFTAVKGEAFEPTLAAALDLSAAMGTDLQSATVMLGKALNDPAAGLSKLTRAGVTFTEQQKAQVKALQESGDMLGAQNVILAEVQKEFGGSAEANATSSAKMKVAFSNAAESLGGSLAPALEATAAVVEKASAAFQSLPAPVQAASGVLVGLAVVGPRIVSGFDKIGPVIKRVGSALKAMRADTEGVGASTSATTQKLGRAAVGVSALTGAVVVGAEAWQEWGRQGTEAAGGWLDQFDKKNGQTVEGLRQTAADAKAFAEGVGKDTSNMAKPFFGLFDVDADRASSEARAAAEAQAAAYEEGAKRIEEVAKATGMSTARVAELLAGLGLSAVTSDTNTMITAIGQAPEVLAAAADSFAGLGAKILGAGGALDGFRKATQAQGDLLSASSKLGDAARGVESAEDSLADAHRGVTSAMKSARDASQGLADARETEGQALDALAAAQAEAVFGSKDLEAANKGVKDAEEALAQSQRDSKLAQEDLTRARDAAKESLDDLGRSAEGAALGEESAKLGLAEAKQRLAELGKPDKDGKAKEVSALDRQRAVLAVKQAELSLRDAIDRNEDTAQELKDATVKGVEGSDQVVAAKERIKGAAEKETEAQQAVVEATLHVTEVQEAAAARVVDAQHKVEDAQRGVQKAAEGVAEAHYGVVQAQQAVVDQSEAVDAAREKSRLAAVVLGEAVNGLAGAYDRTTQAEVGSQAVSVLQGIQFDALAAKLGAGAPLRQNLAAYAAELAAIQVQESATNLGDAFAGAFGFARRASGGSVSAGVPVVVGDGGRSELFVPSADGTIMPDARKALAGAGATVTLNVHGVTDPMAVAEMASARVARQLRLVSAA